MQGGHLTSSGADVKQERMIPIPTCWHTLQYSWPIRRLTPRSRSGDFLNEANHQTSVYIKVTKELGELKYVARLVRFGLVS